MRISDWSSDVCSSDLTLGLAIFQSFGAALALEKSGVAINPGVGFLLVATLTLVTGTMFLMWLGEQITGRGVGNGISMIIFDGIVAGFPPALGATGQLVSDGSIGGFPGIDGQIGKASGRER